jgi:3-oxoacyl-[acyl-carrier protein] reductase
MKLLENKVAIITGGSRGIGEAIVLKFAEQGCHVAFTYISDSSAERSEALAEKCIAMGVKAKAYKSNAGNFSDCEAFVAEVVKILVLLISV